MKPEPSTTESELAACEREIIDHVFRLSPSYAVALGIHDYDGRLPDLSQGATDTWATKADALLTRVRSTSREDLSAARRVDRHLLELLLSSGLFDIRDARDYERNPMTYLGTASLTAYMTRPYAPPDVRVEAMVRILEGVPEVLRTARRQLRTPLPSPFLRLSLTIADGLPSHFADAEAMVQSSAPALIETFRSERSKTEASLSDFTRWMREEALPAATDDFALGAERFQKLLWVREGITAPFSDILARGRADLERNQERLRSLAATEPPPGDPGALLERLYRDHPASETLIAEAQQMVEEIKRFVQDRDLVTVPEPSVCHVKETPPYGRGLSTASMDSPGPFETHADEGVYYVTPVDPSWTPQEKEQWLRSLNYSMLRNVTVHEVYPGHYLQFLHFRKNGASLARRVFTSTSFIEGWAHYAEQLAIEAGLSGGRVEAEVAQLHDALLRDCRLIASIGLHTGGMTLPQATELFMREAYFERLPAEREAARGTFNPEYFCYTLGKLEILSLREKLLKERFGGSLRAFHDRLLSFGSPPVGLLSMLFRAAG